MFPLKHPTGTEVQEAKDENICNSISILGSALSILHMLLAMGQSIICKSSHHNKATFDTFLPYPKPFVRERKEPPCKTSL